ncbi:hypothetical protein F2Q70_00015372 [Brassica cretica]|uniref:Uncharacterized protein n=1 Tax=Brassica cretica TaxID=69181 RepID=A0A8S9I521_BRACR|nr:hypothetical protein F2Q70_00015372 [Brassica cretica]
MSDLAHTICNRRIKYITGENAFSTKLHVMYYDNHLKFDILFYIMLTNIQMGVVEDTKGWMVEVNDTIGIDTFPN